MDLKLFSLLISNLLTVNVTTIYENKQKLLEFENRFCFNEILQPMFTAEALGFLLESASDSTIYEISDGLDINLLFLVVLSLGFFGAYLPNIISNLKK